MASIRQDRLNALLKAQNIPSPARPIPGEKTFAEKELDAVKARQAAWSNPPTVNDAQKVTTSEPNHYEPEMSSDNDDEYAAAFTKKPVMKNSTTGKRRGGNPAQTSGSRNSRNRRQGPEHFDTDEEFREELPRADKHGNPITGHFCVFGLVSKFPYKYMEDGNDRVSRHFFAYGKFFDRTWDLYYVHPAETSFMQPLILLPYEQVKALIDLIATTFKADVAVPAFPFTVSFFQDGTPQPQHLGTSHSREDIDTMQAAIPAPISGHGEAPETATPIVHASYADFKAKVERALAANKRKNVAAKEKKAADKLVQIRHWCQSLGRAQRYLGLVPTRPKLEITNPNMLWEEQTALIAEQDKPITVSPLDVSRPAPFNFDQIQILISIDVESYERGHHLITEVGISTLDTLDLLELAPGENGENWRKQIRSRHFRIAEHAHLKNVDFCIGDPAAFQFGESEMVALADVGDKIDSCFEWPFSIQYKHDGALKEQYTTWETIEEKAKLDSNNTASEVTASKHVEEDQKGPKDRNILLVGQDINSDLNYLARLNSAIFSSKNFASTHPVVENPDVESADPRIARGAKRLQSIKEALDTATLHKVLMKDQNARSLVNILYDLDITGYFLHNAGNDARYTLEALIAMTVKSRLMDDEAQGIKVVEGKNNGETSGSSVAVANRWEVEKKKRLAEKIEMARREVEEECRAWDTALGDSLHGPDVSMTPFSETIAATHAAQERKQKRKTAEEKSRELTMALRQEYGVDGPCDWAVGGKGGCAR